MQQQNNIVPKSPFGITYQDILDFFGMSNTQFIIFLLLFISIVSFLQFLRQLGILRLQHFEYINFKDVDIVYTTYQGRYELIGEAFQKVRVNVSRHFKNSQMVGIYYDNPKQMTDPEKCRAIIGVIAAQQDVKNIQIFVNRNPNYKHKEIQQCKMLRTDLPFVNNISFFLLPMFLYPRLNKYIKSKGLEKHLRGGIIQYYRLAEGKIDVMVPLQKHKQWKLVEDVAQMKKQI